jgi:outer membrane protein
MKTLSIIALAVSAAFCANSFAATNLVSVYNQAINNDGTYLAALQTFKASSMATPIAFGAFLPTVAATANTTWNNKSSAGTRAKSNAHGYTFTITQPLFDYSALSGYKQATQQVKQATVTYNQAKQTLILNVAKAYFQVLNDEQNVRYAKSNETSLKQQMKQAQQQFQVGLKAKTDVLTAQASYDSARAQTVSAENTLHNDLEALAVYTGRPEQDLASLKTNFPLLKPNPSNPQSWVKTALQNNLNLKAAQAQAGYDKAGINAQRGGNTSAAGYYPTLSAVGTYADATDSSVTTKTTSAALKLSVPIFNGFITENSVKQAGYTYDADVNTTEQARRNAISNMRQSYLTILSDISQVKAYHQAVISSESSLKATMAAYQVGTDTIVTLLQQQSALFQNQQLYANAIFSYITDSLQLKATAGLLGPKDIVAINQWLEAQAITGKSKPQK